MDEMMPTRDEIALIVRPWLKSEVCLCTSENDYTCQSHEIADALLAAAHGEGEDVKLHKCHKSRACCCSISALELSEDCTIHSAGPWPLRCDECGRFLSWETRKGWAAGGEGGDVMDLSDAGLCMVAISEWKTLLKLAQADSEVCAMSDEMPTREMIADTLARFCHYPESAWAAADALLALLRPAWERMEQELAEWRVNAHADDTGHLHRCAKVNGVWSCHKGCAIQERDALRADLRACVEALEEAWAEVHAGHGDLNSPRWVSLQDCVESACVRARAALARPGVQAVREEAR